MKLPSTPDIEYLPELNTPDQEEYKLFTAIVPQFTKLNKPNGSTPGTPDNSKKHLDIHQLALIKPLSTPESSQTDSDDVSPQIQRKRKTGHSSKDILPRFSISVEDEFSG
jgi:microtubule-associated serine/threonine kinase